MTKEMETPAGLLIEASRYATANLDDRRSRANHEAVHYAFIAGAEWQKAQPIELTPHEIRTSMSSNGITFLDKDGKPTAIDPAKFFKAGKL